MQCTQRRHTRRNRLTAAMAATLAVYPLLHAQTQGATLPATAPTSAVSPSQLPSANPPVAPPAPQSSQVSWDGTTLQVQATNASLNGLIGEIAAKANLQISGSVPEDRVFGTYGPGKLEDVLSELLDGISVNMLFVDRGGAAKKQLLLTSRTGGPSAPTPTPQYAYQNNDPNGFTNQNGNASQSPDAGRAEAYQPNDPPSNAANPASSNGSDGTPSTGARTPQEIFEQLQRLRARSAAH